MTRRPRGDNRTVTPRVSRVPRRRQSKTPQRLRPRRRTTNARGSPEGATSLPGGGNRVRSRAGSGWRRAHRDSDSFFSCAHRRRCFVCESESVCHPSADGSRASWPTGNRGPLVDIAVFPCRARARHDTEGAADRWAGKPTGTGVASAMHRGSGVSGGPGRWVDGITFEGGETVKRPQSFTALWIR